MFASKRIIEICINFSLVRKNNCVSVLLSHKVNQKDSVSESISLSLHFSPYPSNNMCGPSVGERRRTLLIMFFLVHHTHKTQGCSPKQVTNLQVFAAQQSWVWINDTSKGREAILKTACETNNDQTRSPKGHNFRLLTWNLCRSVSKNWFEPLTFCLWAIRTNPACMFRIKTVFNRSIKKQMQRKSCYSKCVEGFWLARRWVVIRANSSLSKIHFGTPGDMLVFCYSAWTMALSGGSWVWPRWLQQDWWNICW